MSENKTLPAHLNEGEKAILDYTRVNRKWSKLLNRSVGKTTKAVNRMNRLPPRSTDPAVVNAFFDSQDEVWDILEAESEVQAELVSQVLVSVPESWVIAGAPDEIDWSDPANLEEYLTQEAFSSIMQMLVGGKAAEADSKN